MHTSNLATLEALNRALLHTRYTLCGVAVNVNCLLGWNSGASTAFPYCRAAIITVVATYVAIYCASSWGLPLAVYVR